MLWHAVRAGIRLAVSFHMRIQCVHTHTLTHTCNSFIIYPVLCDHHIHTHTDSLCVHMLAEHLFTQFTDPNARFFVVVVEKIQQTHYRPHAHTSHEHLHTQGDRA